MSAMHLTSLLDTSLIFTKSPLRDIAEIYSFMLKSISKKFSINESVEDMLQKLLTRKLDDGFFFPTGVMIPHLHLHDFDDTLLSILIPNEPIETEVGKIKVFVMVLSGKKDNSMYLHILQSVIKFSKDTELFNNILSSSNPQKAVEYLKTADLHVKRAVTVSDLMHENIITVKKETTLKELSNLFYKHNFGYFLVLDDNEKLIGEVTVIDYMMVGIPAYTNFLQNLNFLKSFEPFERLLKEEHNITVESVMKPIEITISPDTSVFEAVFLMNKHNKRDIPILKDDKLIGIISFMDIFRKVIKG